MFNRIICSCLLVMHTMTAFAVVEEIPLESGFSGNVALGITALQYENNMVAGIDSINVTDEGIDNLNDPESTSSGLPIIGLDLKYTFAKYRVQMYAGSALSDILRFDFATRFGVRKQFSEVGIIDISYLSTFGVNVWEDPYNVGVDRKKTSRENSGLGLRWQRIMNSSFTIDLHFRDIAIDNEQSGLTNGLTTNEQDALNREGKQDMIEVIYEHKLNDNNIIEPALIYTDYKLDGTAMKHKRYEGQLSHYYIGETFIIVSNLVIGAIRYDENNPIFNKKNGGTIFGIGSNVIYQKPFNQDNWQAFAGFAFYKGNADIDFYSTRGELLNLGMIYNF